MLKQTGVTASETQEETRPFSTSVLDQHLQAIQLINDNELHECVVICDDHIVLFDLKNDRIFIVA